MDKLKPIRISTESISTISNLCSALDITPDELRQALEMPPDERYKAKKVFKKNGDPRMVFNPHSLIRKIQRRVNERIFSNPDVIEWPSFLYGSIPNQVSAEGDHESRDYIHCAAKHCGAKSLLTMDIKDFFDNIHRDLVYEVFFRFLKYSEEVSVALANLCCRNDHVVQGALTSSYIACLCLWDVEADLVRKLSYKNLTYTRLVDDLNVSSKFGGYDFRYAEKLIEDMLHKKGLPLNSSKKKIQRLSSVAISVHGLRVNFSTPRLPADDVKKIRASVKRLELLSVQNDYKTTHPYRNDFNRCMGRVNKLKRVGHSQHESLYKRLKVILPLPSKKDIHRIQKSILEMQQEYDEKRGWFIYRRRYYRVLERIAILQRTFKREALEFREQLKMIPPLKRG